jgi:general stress protein 26
MGPVTVLLAAVLTLAWPSGPAGPSQPAAAPQPDRAAVIKVATGIVQRARFCTLVTIGAGGHPQARIMDTFPPDEGMVVWMATTPASRKVGEIRKDPRVTLSCFDANTMGYVTLLGRAGLVTDPGEKAKRWKEDWAKIYKDANRGDDYLLIKVTPIRLEVSAEGEGIKNDPKTWRPVIVEFQ